MTAAPDDAGSPIDWSGGGGRRAEDEPGDQALADQRAAAYEGEERRAPSEADAGDDRPGAESEGRESDQPAPTSGETDDGAASEADPSPPPAGDGDLAATEAERDEYLERLQRLQAEFENYRKRMTKEQGEALQRGAQHLASELLVVLDGCEAALQQGLDDVGPIRNQLVEILTKSGLETTGAEGDPFDPELHDAVMHEPADDGDDASTIAEVLRTGYSWKGRVLRPAMVKVRG